MSISFFFDLHRVFETLRVPTNPEGAQALSKEFPTSAPRVMGRLKDLEEQGEKWTEKICPYAIKLYNDFKLHKSQFKDMSCDSKKSKSPPDVPLSAPQPMVEAAAPSRALVQKPVAPLRALVDEDEIEDELEGWMSSLC
ncbi:hypothetical protein FXO38_25177 [Capsicum annuum]|nr:hypothetical protein FXO38_25177 [Capsicum annuum]